MKKILVIFSLISLPGFSQDSLTIHPKIFTDSVMVDGFYNTLEDFLNNKISITDLTYKMKSKKMLRHELQLYDSDKDKYVGSKNEVFAVHYKDDLYILRFTNHIVGKWSEHRYLRVIDLGPYITSINQYENTYHQNESMEIIPGTAALYNQQQLLKKEYISFVEVYDYKQDRFFPLKNQKQVRSFLVDYPKLLNEYNALWKKDRKMVVVVLRYVKRVNDILLGKVQETNDNEKEDVASVSVPKPKPIELNPNLPAPILTDSIIKKGIYKSPIEFLANRPSKMDLGLKLEPNGKSYNLSIYVEDAKEYKTGCNQYFGFYDGTSFYLNPNHKKTLLDGGKMYYKIGEVTPITHVCTLTTYEEGTFFIVYDSRVQEFKKIVKIKDLMSLLADNTQLTAEYDLLKGREQRDVEVQLKYIGRLNDLLLVKRGEN